jgi:hypothetical protein
MRWQSAVMILMIRRFARPYARAIMDAAGSPQKANACAES